MFNNIFPENRTVYETMFRNVVEPDRPQVVIKYGACALHAEYVRLHAHANTPTRHGICISTHTQMCNTY